MELNHINTLDTTEQWVSSKESIWFPSPNLTWVKDEPGGVHTYLSPGKPLPNIDNHIFTNAVTDYDGNNYDAVIIGDQVWTTSNLKTRHYTNGFEIIAVDSPNSIDNPQLVVNKDTEDFFYNCYAANSKEGAVLPSKWIIPTVSHFNHLKEIMENDSRYYYMDNGVKIGPTKSLASVSGWTSSGGTIVVGSPLFNPETNNRSGFNAKPTSVSVGKNVFVFTIGTYVAYQTLFNGDTMSTFWFRNDSASLSPVTVNFITKTIPWYAIRCVYGGTVKEFLKEYNVPLQE